MFAKYLLSAALAASAIAPAWADPQRSASRLSIAGATRTDATVANKSRISGTGIFAAIIGVIGAYVVVHLVSGDDDDERRADSN